jgi:hypothetical protein
MRSTWEEVVEWVAMHSKTCRNTEGKDLSIAFYRIRTVVVLQLWGCNGDLQMVLAVFPQGVLMVGTSFNG